MAATGSTPSSKTTQHAGFPFNRTDADVVLRSSDGVDFHVHRAILTVASPFFETMFRLPQPASSPPEAIDVTENNKTLDVLLRICYPVPDPYISSFELACSTLEAALKYDMNAGVDYVKNRVLPMFIKKMPLRVFAIACKHSFETLARQASKEVLAQHAVPDLYVPELETISAGCYRRLVQSQQGRAVWYVLGGHQGTQQGFRSDSSHYRDASFPFNDTHADIDIVTSDGVRFRALGAIMKLASPVWRTMLSEAAERKNEAHGSLILPVPEDSKTIDVLLRCCYPLETPTLNDAQSLAPVLAAAKRYEMGKAISFLSRRFTDLTPSDALTSYLIASSHEWTELAKDAAGLLRTRSRKELLATYVICMESTMAGPYYRLLQYHKKCGETAAELFTPEVAVPSVRISLTTVSCSQCGRWRLDSNPTWLTSVAIAHKAMLEEIIRDLEKCSQCLRHIGKILDFFSVFERAVDEAVAKVDTKMLFVKPT
ncbi:uncharacterized protein LAESUDRAFT_812302 [Laetiporus sulphureus 93-53]|uniref:BTB domain-containing protein n=1 Tax=Laetiporus sulphureus 93-53 TaxID=1314785 RepID=A0A165ELP5_9APHY|nr:uncharacterized protein LAESUDRAFT_812302 [Laetiporus sulphureus 93-53]KZT07317.1 hypothetical protein LAESUDRAFT_812302 [Laetiporus sulphureus 93-53]